jgi:Tfp pilus assembly protein PilF
MDNRPPPHFRARGLLSAIALPLLLATGCTTFDRIPPAVAPTEPPKAESYLTEGLRAYEDGRYPAAQKRLRDALEEGLRKREDRVVAHKHLAFLYCATKQEVLCRDAFRRALEIDPAFQLTPAEAGHPQWGPVFRSLKPKGAS